jgi:hypothetical protein
VIFDLVLLVCLKSGTYDGFLVGVKLREQQVLVTETHVRRFRVHPILHPDTCVIKRCYVREDGEARSLLSLPPALLIMKSGVSRANAMNKKAMIEAQE